jgi:hypothetical protein
MGILWTSEEREALVAEGVRLVRAGKSATIIDSLTKAQLAVLPKARRREIDATSKVPWFSAAIKAAKEALNVPTLAPDETQAPVTKVFWKEHEKALLCDNAARLLTDMQAQTPREALEMSQLMFPKERQRKIHTMTSVADWYFDGVKKATAELLKKRQAAATEQAKLADQAVSAKLADEAAALTPEPAPAPTVTPVAQALAPSKEAAFPSMFTNWPTIREHLVQEIAALVAEGIHRGLASVQISASADEMNKPTTGTRHVPFVVDPKPKKRPPSVLVVGLRGGQAPQISSDFGSSLDLRFCNADQSKHELRSMAEQADMTVAVVDFLSHSHTDIIKARAKRYVESSGGMTSLRSELAQIAGMHLNGTHHALS